MASSFPVVSQGSVGEGAHSKATAQVTESEALVVELIRPWYVTLMRESGMVFFLNLSYINFIF